MTNVAKIIGIFVAAGLGLSACTGPERFEGQNSYEKTQKGALIGGLVGAVGGMITGTDAEDKRNRALKGAIIGGGAGAIIGNQLDKQEAELRNAMGNDNVLIQNTGDRLIVTLPQDILFAVDSTALRPDLMSDIGALAANLRSYPNTTVQVIGHTDNTGAANYNQSLSVGRATSVANALVGNGVSRSRIIATGRGEDQPVASNLTAEGRAQNRRVEIVILPNAVNG